MLFVDSNSQTPPQIFSAARRYWVERARQRGSVTATRDLITALWEFLRDSTPSRLRSRFGDADYDWDYRVNTTSGAVGWRDRLLGVFHSPYQPTEPELFREMLDALEQQTNLNFADFTFLDLGSGKGRTLLMASDYRFHRIVGVELLPALHAIAEENLAHYKSDSQKCFALESICGDATAFALPDEPLIIYLFNPFPEAGLRRTLANLRETLAKHPRAAYVLYHNPQLEHVLIESRFLSKIAGTHQYSVFAAQINELQNVTPTPPVM
jgi:SAM-dependent methyltransferase